MSLSEDKMSKETKKKAKKRTLESGEKNKEMKKVRFKIEEPPAKTKEQEDIETEENSEQNLKKQKLALKYLKTWKKKREIWSFRKNQQTWLLKNVYDEDKINDKYFKYLILYLEGLKGNGRKRILEEAEAYFKNDENSDSAKIERARKVIQILAE